MKNNIKVGVLIRCLQTFGDVVYFIAKQPTDVEIRLQCHLRLR